MELSEIKLIFKKGLKAVVELVNNLYGKINELIKRVEELENQLSKYEIKNKELINQKSKNSTNSSKPPTTDGFNKKKKKTRSLREKSKLKSGGQVGHKGTTLEMVPNPDKIIPIEVINCKNCNHHFEESEKHIEKKQVKDIPSLKALVTEYELEVGLCPICEIKTIGDFPFCYNKDIQYGPNIKSYVVYESKYNFIPLNRIVKSVKGLFKINLSEGTVCNFISEFNLIIKSPVELIKQGLIKSKIVCFDESGGRCNGKLNWFHVATNKVLTYFSFNPKRGKKGMDAAGILPFFKGKAVHDCYASYYNYIVEHVLCNAHILRELIFEKEENLQKWAGEMINLLLSIKLEVKERIESGKSKLSPKKINQYESEYDKILKKGFRKNPYQEKESNKKGKAKQSDTYNLLKRLREHKSEFLAFMYDFEVPFDNNLSERDIRMLKVYIKVSGCFRSLSGAQAFCNIRSYLLTAKKQGVSAYQAINDTFHGKPFMPNISE